MENYEVFRVELGKDGTPLDSMGLQLKLSQKKLFSFGGSSYDKQEAVHEIGKTKVFYLSLILTGSLYKWIEDVIFEFFSLFSLFKMYWIFFKLFFFACRLW